MYKFLTSLAIFSLLLAGCMTREKEQAAPLQTDAYAPAKATIAEARYLLKDGDLVVRSGTEMASQMIRQLNKEDKTYSHSGVVFFENNYPFIYHIVAGDENPDSRIKKDSLESFCNPRKNAGFAIYRFDLDAAEKTSYMKQIADWYEKGIKFDSVFDMKTEDRMYCSEMIKKGLERATAGRIHIGLTKPTPQQASFFASHLHLPKSYSDTVRVVTTDNLFLNPNCRLVKRFDLTPPQQ